MNSIKSLTIFLFLLAISSICFGQEIVEDENWLSEVGGVYTNYYRITYQFNDFTIEDVATAKQKLSLIRKISPKNEWEGLYYKNIAIGDSRMIWNSESGFFSFYFYHELKGLNYGRVYNSPHFIELFSDKKSNNDKKKLAKTKLIKVKIDKKHFLVPENRLQDFCDSAAGLSTDLSDFNYYWKKEADMEKEILGLPVLAPEYKRFLRYPVEAKIISIENKKIVPNEQSTKEFNFDDIHYPITLNAGKNKNIKIGMNFFVEDLGEWIEIMKVSQKSSIGFIGKGFDENKQERCRDSEGGSGQIILCKEIRNRMKAKTKGNL